MFKTLDITKFGLFEDFEWSKNLHNNQFSKLNIIYGRNYSGKTTLSRMFGSIDNGHLPEKYRNGVFTITDESGKKVDNLNLTSDYKIRVYNTDFVRNNLNWLHDDENGEIKPFALLGGGNIAARTRIDEVINELGSTEEKSGLYFECEQKNKAVDNAKDEEDKKQKEIDNALKKQANEIIKVNKYFVKQGDNYNVTNIKSEIEKLPNNSSILDVQQEDEHKKIIDEIEKPSIKDITVFKPKLSQLIEETKELVQKRITVTNTIKDLLEDNLLQNWVENGIKHHKDKRSTCAFCNNQINSNRWQQIDEHFSKESEDLKKSILVKITDIEEAKNNIVNYIQNQDIKKDSFYAVYHTKFDLIISKWNNVVTSYCSVVVLLTQKLEERHSDIFKPKEFGSDENNILNTSNNIVEEVFSVLESIKNLSIESNNKTNTLSDDKTQSRKLLRYSEIQKFLNIFSYSQKQEELKNAAENLKTKKKEFKLINTKIDELEIEKKLKQLELNDEGAAAKKVNKHLVDFFGHDGLTLEPEVIEGIEPRTRFVIMRSKEKAHNLSEGECSLISFCYFIAKMEDELNGANHEKLIIYIDDPISSLDNNHIFFMYSLIETVIAKKQKYRQLIISTHNLDFLKYLKRLTIPRDEKNPLVSYFIIEKHKKYEATKSVIKDMPAYLKNYVTEYNFLFEEIYNMAKPFNSGNRWQCIENQYTQFYNLPNNMRKFLECYLFYRFPNTDDPLKNLSLLFADHIPILVNRVINEYSHLSWGERGTIVMDVAEAESVAKEILKAIYQNDSGHYTALCKSIGVDEIDFS